MTADVIAMRDEAASIASRRADAIARPPATVSKQCPPHAALLHRIASLMTTDDLPAAHLSVRGTDVVVDTSACELVENATRRYAAAVGLDVVEVPTEANGFAATMWDASGYDGTRTWWHIVGVQLHPTPIVDRFGVGFGPSS